MHLRGSYIYNIILSLVHILLQKHFKMHPSYNVASKSAKVCKIRRIFCINSANQISYSSTGNQYPRFAEGKVFLGKNIPGEKYSWGKNIPREKYSWGRILLGKNSPAEKYSRGKYSLGKIFLGKNIPEEKIPVDKYSWEK